MEDNPNYYPSTSIAYLILTGTSAWAIRQTNPATPVALGTFSFLVGHGILGVLNFGHPTTRKLEGIYEGTSLLAEIIPLPLINYELYNIYDLKTFANAHAVTAALPLVTYIILEKHHHNDKIIDLVLLWNITALIYITMKTDSAWAAGLAAISTMNHYVYRRISERLNVPKMDMIAIGLSFFNIFAVNTLSEHSKG